MPNPYVNRTTSGTYLVEYKGSLGNNVKSKIITLYSGGRRIFPSFWGDSDKTVSVLGANSSGCYSRGLRGVTLFCSLPAFLLSVLLSTKTKEQKYHPRSHFICNTLITDNIFNFR